MPIFDSEFLDDKNDVIGYYSSDSLIAFSILRKHSSKDVEALQFAWNYKQPKLRLGINSLKHECAFYKSLNYTNLYLGEVYEYKKKFKGYEELGLL